MTLRTPAPIYSFETSPEGIDCWSKLKPGSTQHREAMAKIATQLQAANASIFTQTIQGKDFNDLRSKSAAHYNKTHPPKISPSWLSSMFSRIASAFYRIKEFATNLFNRQISVK